MSKRTVIVTGAVAFGMAVVLSTLAGHRAIAQQSVQKKTTPRATAPTQPRAAPSTPTPQTPPSTFLGFVDVAQLSMPTPVVASDFDAVGKMIRVETRGSIGAVHAGNTTAVALTGGSGYVDLRIQDINSYVTFNPAQGVTGRIRPAGTYLATCYFADTDATTVTTSVAGNQKVATLEPNAEPAWLTKKIRVAWQAASDASMSFWIKVNREATLPSRVRVYSCDFMRVQ